MGDSDISREKDRLLREMFDVARACSITLPALNDAKVARFAPSAGGTAAKIRTLDQLLRFAKAACVRLEVLPVVPAIEREARRSMRQRRLAEPQWGLAWSNPEASDASLIANALLRGSYAHIVSAALEYGLDEVEAMWSTVQSSGKAQIGPPVSNRLKSTVDRMLRNIRAGFDAADDPP